MGKFLKQEKNKPFRKLIGKRLQNFIYNQNPTPQNRGRDVFINGLVIMSQEKIQIRDFWQKRHMKFTY